MGLSTAMKSRITEVLDHFPRYQFAVNYGDEDNPLAAIAVSASPEYRFIISAPSEDAFTTSETPGIRSGVAETFQRSDFEMCVKALREWVERIIDGQSDWILDEFGGVADRDPSLGK